MENQKLVSGAEPRDWLRGWAAVDWIQSQSRRVRPSRDKTRGKKKLSCLLHVDMGISTRNVATTMSWHLDCSLARLSVWDQDVQAF